MINGKLVGNGTLKVVFTDEWLLITSAYVFRPNGSGQVTMGHLECPATMYQDTLECTIMNGEGPLRFVSDHGFEVALG